MIFQPIMQSLGEPILIGGALAGGGAVLVWFARTAIETRDTMRKLADALYDDTTGLVKMVYAHHRDVQGAVGQLSHEHVEFDKRLTRVEDRCDMTHGNGQTQP